MLGKAVQFLKKCGKGNGGAIGIANYGTSLDGEASDGEGHGDAVVAAWIDFGTAQFSGSAARNLQAVRAFFDCGVHAAKIFGERGDAVAFFDAKFRGVANLDAFFGVRTERGGQGWFIDYQGDLFACDYAALERGAFHG